MDLPKFKSLEEVVQFLRRFNHRLYVRPLGEIPHSSGPWYVVRTQLITSAPDPLVRIYRAESTVAEERTLGACFDGLKQGVPIAEVPESVCKAIESKLDSDDDIRWLSTRPITRCFVYLDISDYSTYPSGQPFNYPHSAWLFRPCADVADDSDIPLLRGGVRDGMDRQ
ncbi:MAG: hypothetical protein IT452_07320 [Planctomycetia bacterium]|nr:hypothetical protein [Planctomycetia bacterium]